MVIYFILPFTAHHPGKLRPGTWKQEPMQRSWRDAARCLAPHDLLSLLSYATQDNLIRFGTIHSGLDPLTSLRDQENILQIWLQANLNEAISQLRFPFPKRLSFLSKLTKLNQHSNRSKTQTPPQLHSGVQLPLPGHPIARAI